MRYLIHSVAVLTFCFSLSVAEAQNKVVVVPMGGATGDARPPDVVEGKTFSSKAGKGLTGTRSPGALASTGQPVCYDPACTVAPCDEVPCAGTGEDGELQTGVTVSPRFVDNGDGTVTDRLTGLVWLREGNCTTFFAGDSTGVNERPWAAALTAAKQLASSFCGLTDGSVAGDWRLPNLRELQSLVDYSQFNPCLPPDHPFLNTASSYYWSSTTYAYSTSLAWLVYFNIGDVYYGGNKSISYYVRAVRGGQ